jgi:hypothetical protein
LDRRLHEPQSLSGHCGEEKILLTMPVIDPGHPTCNLSLYQLSCSERIKISCNGIETWNMVVKISEKFSLVEYADV